MSKSKQRKQSALEEITKLQKKRRVAFCKCAGCLICIIAVVAVKTYLVSIGAIATSSIAAGAVVMMAGIGLAVVAGTASIEARKCKNTIAMLAQRNGVRKEEISGLRQHR